MRRSPFFLLVALLLATVLPAALGGCAPPDPGPPSGAQPPAAADPDPDAPAPAPPPPLSLADTRVDVLDLPALQTLEDEAWSAAAIFARMDGQPAPPRSRVDLAQLADSSSWGAVAALLQTELDAVITAMQWDVVTDHREAVRWPAGNVSRAFDTRWLRSSRAQLRLAGVVQRIDRQDLHDTPGCGEVRFVYRLSYAIPDDTGALRGSRLPVALNAVFRPTATDCGAWARRWGARPTVAGVLDPAGLRFDRLEVDAQVIRLPAGVATEAGGQAAYLFAVITLGPDGQARLEPLENTPDVPRIEQDPVLRQGLIDWINDHSADIDQGTYLLPRPFLTTRALSWSTAGTNRLANRPFSALFPPETRAALRPPGEGARHVASRAGLVDRLDNGTCTGCHQAGSTAGFHLLGVDDPALAGVTNRLAGGLSPHLRAERERRRVRTRDLANGAPVDRFRAHSLQPAVSSDGTTIAAADQPCLPAAAAGALQPGARWGCGSGQVCAVLTEDPAAAVGWGMCVPQDPTTLTAGMSCRQQTTRARFRTGRRRASSGLPWATHAYADVFSQHQRHDLPEDKRFSATALNCRPPVLGVPLGRAYRSCTAAERSLEEVRTADGSLAPALCGVVGGSAFDACVEGDFHGCMEKIVGRGMVAACDPDHPCREDHACQALPWQLAGVPSAAGQALADQGVGFCTPTYFLFQLRLDGHPPPG